MEISEMLLGVRGQVVINDGDLHAVVSICTIFLLIVAVISTFSHIFTKIAVTRRLALDDYAAFPALVSMLALPVVSERNCSEPTVF